MRAIPIAFFVLTALAPSSAWTQDAEDVESAKKQVPANAEVVQAGPTSMSTRGKRVDNDSESLFSDAEIGDLYQKASKANERSQPKAENNIYAVDVEGPIIELDPYIVEGDDSLIMARVRREMERRPESVRRRLAELSPRMAGRAQDDGRAQNRIMTDDLRAGASDVPSTGGFTVGEVSHALGDALRALFEKEK